MSSISSIGSSAGQWAQVSSSQRPPGGGPDPAKMFARVDTDGSGGVNETELQAMLDKVNERVAAMGGSAVDAKEAFSSFDTDGDGSLNADELDAGMKGLMSAQGMGGPQGAGGPPPMGPPPGAKPSDDDSEDEESTLDQLLSAIDSDQDGALSADEIASFKKIAEALAKVYDASSQESSSLCVAA